MTPYETHEEIYRDTGLPNPVMLGGPGAGPTAYPKGTPPERVARALRRLVAVVRRRPVS